MEKFPEHALEALLSGSRIAVARAVSAIENETDEGRRISAAIAGHRGRAHVFGITGAPGAGKSTLISALLGELLRRDVRIAVVAVDPSSPKSGGAVLGDRIRMGEHGADERVFIRSLSARGHLGGISRTTKNIVDVFDAAGFAYVIVETVGAGQSEVDIAHLADTSIVVCPPGLGDDVQAIKAGILEIADLLVVNKGDSPLAERTLKDLQNMLHLRPASAPKVPVLLTTATGGAGVAELLAAILDHGARNGTGRRLAVADRAPPATAPTNSEFDPAVHIRNLAARDAFVNYLGIDRVEGGAGNARVGMTIGPQHINFHGTCHGGVIFSLADTAFGMASNAYGVTAVGIDTHMTYQVAVKEGERLTAIASELSRSHKIGVYRIEVLRDDVLISIFTGTVYITGQTNT